MKIRKIISLFSILSIFAASSFGQTETPPRPGSPRPTKIPSVSEKKLPNGLTVAVIERKNVPLVTVRLLIKNGAAVEKAENAGLANLTAQMLTKGTKTRTATQIAEQMEFLGGSITSGAGWNNSNLTMTVTGDKLEAAMTILADVVMNPSFKKEELDLLKAQTLDSLTYNLKQPGFLAAYVASRYSFDEHPAGGTPESIGKISVENIVEFKKENYQPQDAVLIFTGDITSVRANSLAQRFFGRWRLPKLPVDEIVTTEQVPFEAPDAEVEKPLIRRILVVDMPNSGQAAVNYNLSVEKGRTDFDDKGKVVSSSIFYPALVFNSVLGGGYSSRLNQEIRIKRGLSYGAGSSFNWRDWQTNFGTRTQTKNESAAEVAELVEEELKKMIDGKIPANELAPRKLVLTGDFGRDLETTAGLAEVLTSLYTFGLPMSDLSSHIQKTDAVSDAQIKTFAREYLKGGDIIIVGDYSVFKDDLAKRFPKMRIEIIKVDGLDMSKINPPQ